MDDIELETGAEAAEQVVEAAIHDGKLLGYTEKFGIAAAVMAGQALLIWLVWLIFKKISSKIKADAGSRIRPLTIKNYKILSAKQIVNVILFLLRILKYLITIFQLFITFPIIFSLYPATEKLASTIFGYILHPLKNILMDTVKFIPNLITIIIILLIAKYVLRGLKFFANQIAKGKLVFPGFYAEWAWPTFNILRVFLYAFTIAVIYPNLPGSESQAFRGVSVFVGIIFSLGSSSAIGNLIAGLVITYMRPFRIGDRIKIKELTGFVVEKSPFVVRIRNIKNEYITFPNLMVLNSEVINYNTSVEEEEEGLLLHAKITMGYDVPWRQVHEILLAAAAKTPNVEESPEPFVLQTSLNDFYAEYEVNVAIKQIEKFQLTYSLLYQNIQDGFTGAGISMIASHYFTRPPEAPPVAPKRPGKKRQEPAQKPAQEPAQKPAKG